MKQNRTGSKSYRMSVLKLWILPYYRGFGTYSVTPDRNMPACIHFEEKNDKEAIKKAEYICEEEHNKIVKELKDLLDKTRKDLAKRKPWEIVSKRRDREGILCLESVLQDAKKEKCCILLEVESVKIKRIFSSE